jgi:hypothetical protein
MPTSSLIWRFSWPKWEISTSSLLLSLGPFTSVDLGLGHSPATAKTVRKSWATWEIERSATQQRV